MPGIVGLAEAVAGIDFDIPLKFGIINREIYTAGEFAGVMRNSKGIAGTKGRPDFFEIALSQREQRPQAFAKIDIMVSVRFAQ